MDLNEIEFKILKENFDEDLIKSVDSDNLNRILKYLENNNIDYGKDLILCCLNLFLMPYEDFVKRFERLKETLGKDYADRLGEDISLIEIMYSD